MTDKQKKVIQVAIGELGQCESPTNSNKQKYGEWIGMNAVPWCAIFVSWVFDQAGLNLGYIDNPKGFVGCRTAYDHWKKDCLTTAPVPGDIILFDWEKDGKMDHTGIMLQDNGDGTVMTIEGNTAIGNDSNGGQVMLRRRGKQYCTFVHPEVFKPE